ncbi:uncharacterized protein LOC129611138 [Condylostylus longicornis]|uniref:uncharacterized protein LOC129611138 n=1 Tax=Condylostylus longicornis TaxID=2530218 RepID=UPI00244DB522|nr:uncharacterized protein LOC129611138 [Condylostylus longicornis]
MTYGFNTDDYPVDATLNYFIRTCIGLHGTKYMCYEGGCGSCNVTCLRLLGTCDGLEITTIEGIGNKKDGYHPIQKTLANSNGSQCGYCSPGMAMTMYGLLERDDNKPLTAEEIEKSFDGNICRCTGYRPILDAMKSFANEKIIDIEDLTKGCKKLKISRKKHVSECDDFEFINSSEEYKELFCPIMNVDLKVKNSPAWFSPQDLIELFKIFNTEVLSKKYILVAGGTGDGVFRRPNDIEYFININKISELSMQQILSDRIEIGGSTTISNVLDLLLEASTISGFEYCLDIYNHWSLVATLAVRNVAGLAGNLMIKHDHLIFPSDIFIVLEAIKAQIEIMDNLVRNVHSPIDFLNQDMNKKVITKIILPSYSTNEYIFKSYKVMIRSQNAHALLNAAFLLQIQSTATQLIIMSARLCFGNVSPYFVHATETENFMINKNLLEENVIEQILAKAYDEIYPGIGFDEYRPHYRRILACGLLYKFLLSLVPPEFIAPQYLSGKDTLKRELSYGNQTYSIPSENYPVGQPVHKLEALIQCSGEAFYSNDIPSMNQELWAAYVTATNVGSTLIGINPVNALKMKEIVAFFGAKDIPGNNSFILVGAFPFFIEDEPVFLKINKVVKYYDQPVGILVGSDPFSLKKAVKLVKLTYEKVHPVTKSPIFSLNDIKQKSDLTKRTVSSVTHKTSNSLKDCVHKKQVKSNFSINGQYHFTMEPQTVVCKPTENGITLYCSNQFIDLHHIVLEKFLNMPQKNIYIETVRIGGGYGGKFSRSAQVACAAALACIKLNRPVRFVLTIEEMMRTIGKRMPIKCEYDIEVNMSNGHILDSSIEFFTDLGWSPNESPVSPYTLTAINSCYKDFSNWVVKGNNILTDAPSNTWCRGPGTFEGIAMIETIMDNIAYEIGIDPVNVRLENIADDNKVKKLLPQFVQSVEYQNRKEAIEQFNNENRWIKKGISVSVMQYSLIYFAPQTAYLVIYRDDGTVNISHSGIEMGQGLNTKVLQVASNSLGIPMENISFRPTNSFVTANSIFSAGSCTSETICLAVQKACNEIKSRLQPVRDSISEPNPDWVTVIQKAYAQNVSLNVTQSVFPGEMQSYMIFGLACSEVEVDMLTGNVQVKKVDILEDTGESLSPLIDIGQVEGSFIMALGLWLTEKLSYDRLTGELLTDRPFTYKVPLATDIPQIFNVNLLQNSPNPIGFLRSKATGEPAISLAISVLSAVRHAVHSARKDAGINEWCPLGGPTTPEDVVLNAGTDVTQFHLH